MQLFFAALVHRCIYNFLGHELSLDFSSTVSTKARQQQCLKLGVVCKEKKQLELFRAWMIPFSEMGFSIVVKSFTVLIQCCTENIPMAYVCVYIKATSNYWEKLVISLSRAEAWGDIMLAKSDLWWLHHRKHCLDLHLAQRQICTESPNKYSSPQRLIKNSQ